MTSRPSRYSRRTFVLSMAVLTAVPAGLARAQGMLDAARAAGQVGERFDGYAAVHGAAPAGIQSLVEQVNAERRALYAKAQRIVMQELPWSPIAHGRLALPARASVKGLVLELDGGMFFDGVLPK